MILIAVLGLGMEEWPNRPFSWSLAREEVGLENFIWIIF
jgi:hypothetical protein